MSITQDSYQTTLGSLVVTDKVERSLKEALVNTNLGHQTLGVSPIGDTHCVFLLGGNPIESEIGLFTHPITIRHLDKRTYLVTDMRMLNTDIKEYDLDLTKDIVSHVRNKTEYQFLKGRAILDMVWKTGGVNRLKNDLPFAGVVFATWMSEVISKSFALDFGDQHKLFILTHVYYQSLFLESSTLDAKDKDRMAIHTIKAANSNSSTVYGVLDMVETLGNIRDFCALVPVVTESVRLKDFNLTALLNIIAHSWYGINAKEILGVSLEYPPAWCTLVYTALNERTYRNSLIAKVSERLGKRGNADSYNKSFYTLMRDNSSVSLESAAVLEFNDFE